MTVQIELWHLILLLLAFFGAVGTFGKILLDQVEKRQNERFQTQEKSQTERFQTQDKAREAGASALRETLNQHLEQERLSTAQIQSLERDFLLWKAELPVLYVRREDWVRNQTIIEAKLDGVALKIENLQLKGLTHA